MNASCCIVSLVVRDVTSQGWEMHEDDKGRKYYASKATLKTQWQHPMEEYYKGVVFMRKEGEQLLEEKASRSPPTPEETREMARYFGRGRHRRHTLGVREEGAGRGRFMGFTPSSARGCSPHCRVFAPRCFFFFF